MFWLLFFIFFYIIQIRSRRNQFEIIFFSMKWLVQKSHTLVNSIHVTELSTSTNTLITLLIKLHNWTVKHWPLSLRAMLTSPVIIYEVSCTNALKASVSCCFCLESVYKLLWLVDGAQTFGLWAIKGPFTQNAYLCLNNTHRSGMVFSAAQNARVWRHTFETWCITEIFISRLLFLFLFFCNRMW